MTSRERMLTALSNGRPDRLPCQVHGWMSYYLDHYLGGADQWQAFERGTPQTARRLVRECFEATRDHAGYIRCPSDHFFREDPACLQAFADEARGCVY